MLEIKYDKSPPKGKQLKSVLPDYFILCRFFQNDRYVFMGVQSIRQSHSSYDKLDIWVYPLIYSGTFVRCTLDVYDYEYVYNVSLYVYD